jgi:hypothetical protein
MWEDPIVAEVHRIREQLAAQFNYDIDALFADLMKRQEALGGKLVRVKKRAEPTNDAEQASGAPGSVPSEASTAA